MKARLLRGLGTLALLPLFGLAFWVAATVASGIPGLSVFGVNVHGLGLASYAGNSAQRPAPLSLQLLLDAQNDASGGRASNAPTTAVALPTSSAPAPTPRPRPVPTPTPLPMPTPTLPVPTPTPVPVPTPTPTPTPTLPVPTPTPGPSLLPLPLPAPIPILPSLLPGLLR